MSDVTERERFKDAVSDGIDEMEYSIVDTGVIEIPSSKPATYEFRGEVELRPDDFEDELETRGFSSMWPTYEEDGGEFYYSGEVTTDHYKKLKVKVWNNTVRIYPDGELPDKYELSRIIRAIEASFGGELYHNPADDV